MKKFLLKTLLFLLPLITLLIGSEFLIRNIPNDYNTKLKFLKEQSADIEVLTLGSSHAYYGVNPDLFNNKCFNLSNLAQTPEFDLKLFKKYGDKMDQLKVLLYPISYFTFFWDLQSSPESWRLKNYTIYYQVDAAISLQDYFELLSVNPKQNFQRIMDYYVHDSSEVKVSPLGWGFHSSSKKSNFIDEVVYDVAHRHTYLSSPYFEKNSKEVEEIIQICLLKGIKVILFFPPAFEKYREFVDPKQLKMTYGKIDELLLKYKNLSFVDYFSDTTFTQCDFLDADHLNIAGSSKLSQKLNLEVNQIYRFN